MSKYYRQLFIHARMRELFGIHPGITVVKAEQIAVTEYEAWVESIKEEARNNISEV